MKYAEVNAEGIVTKIVENDGDYYAPEEGSFLVQGDSFKEGQRYEPVVGNYTPALPFLGTAPAAAPKKQKPVQATDNGSES